jgi:hypothetical protein
VRHARLADAAAGLRGGNVKRDRIGVEACSTRAQEQRVIRAIRNADVDPYWLAQQGGAGRQAYPDVERRRILRHRSPREQEHDAKDEEGRFTQFTSPNERRGNAETVYRPVA